jgi:hypothetical protein
MSRFSAAPVGRGKWVMDVCELQSPVVMVVRTVFPLLPITCVTIVSSTKMSKLNPKASGSRL